MTHPNRLLAQAERMLRALEALATPESFAEILRAARALIAVKKAFDLVTKDLMDGDMEAGALEATPETKVEPAILNRHMRRKAEALERKPATGKVPLHLRDTLSALKNVTAAPRPTDKETSAPCVEKSFKTKGCCLASQA